MLRKLVLAGAIAGAAASVPVFLESNPQALDSLLPGGSEPAAQQPVAAMALPQAQEAGTQAPSGRRVRLDADARGHFRADFRLNGRTVPAMVDTGATVVAINRSTARRIGLSLAASDFSLAVETANGRTRAAGAVIDRLEIGRIELRDVPAMVLDDEALSGTLIGMSFLARLKRFQVENGALTLEQ